MGHMTLHDDERALPYLEITRFWLRLKKEKMYFEIIKNLLPFYAVRKDDENGRRFILFEIQREKGNCARHHLFHRHSVCVCVYKCVCV